MCLDYIRRGYTHDCAIVSLIVLLRDFLVSTIFRMVHPIPKSPLTKRNASEYIIDQGKCTFIQRYPRAILSWPGYVEVGLSV